MKIIQLIIFVLIAPYTLAQVGIGKTTVEGSGLLDFAQNTNKGIVLPWITETPMAEKGSLIYSVPEKKVMFFNGSDWMDLSVHLGEVNTSEIDNLNEVGEGIIIGNLNSNKKGVLVLEDQTKALILPKTTKPWENIQSPEPGTIAYDPEAHLICIYNGSEWTFWGQ